MSDMSHNHQKKIAVINDMSGFGRCSIAVELPVISAMKVQCCPLPTSIFSNHTGFESFFDDYTDKMEDYMQEWVKLGLQFNGICTGFLGSARQIRIVEHFLSLFQTKDNIIIIDPVMGDYGKMYPTYTQETCEEMKKLVTHADILTPNLTEGCILSGMAYHESWTKKELTHMAELLAEKGPEKLLSQVSSRENMWRISVMKWGRRAILSRPKRQGCPVPARVIFSVPLLRQMRSTVWISTIR